MLFRSGLISVTLEATLYRPDGPGPFPLVIINHGKESGDPKFQRRYRPTRAARYFLQRGYVVVAPMRQGFSKSGGYYIGAGCNVASSTIIWGNSVLGSTIVWGSGTAETIIWGS